MPGSNPAPEILGQSRLNRPIHLHHRGSGPVRVLFLAGHHGDEVEGIDCLARFLALVDREGPDLLPPEITLYSCPNLNPDGSAARRRTNQRNVDLNRNLPTADWSPDFTNPLHYPGPEPASEPETQALIRLLERVRPRMVVSLHSWKVPMVNYNGEISRALAEVMSRACGLPAKGDVGYPTPGSFGTYSAIERGIPTITLEILAGQALDEVWRQHRPALEAALEWGRGLLAISSPASERKMRGPSPHQRLV